jgi:5-methylcytosine-specific restriction endonuclease McrA
MSKVFVLDTEKYPLNPVHPGRARLLLTTGRAAVYKRYPFTIILKRTVEHPQVKPLRIKLDPGSKTTGIAIVNDASGEVIFAAELVHRGQAVKAALVTRRAVRRSRRHRHTRYRQPRFKNRRQRAGRLPPSIESRITNVLTWVTRLRRLCPISAISLEVAKFDTQLMQIPDISGVQYQQGTLAGYEVREYVLEKWQRQCAYCGAKEVPLQVEHIQSPAKGGSNRVSNLTLACEVCNVAKGTQDIKAFLAHKPDVLQRLLTHAKAPLRDAAAINTTRWALYERLQALGMPVECGTGGRTKYNRVKQGLKKMHWIDAACVGASTPEHLKVQTITPLHIEAMGRQRRQMCLMDKHGFPRTKTKQRSTRHPFRTGDIVRAVVAAHLKHAGTYVGRMAAKANGAFTVTTGNGMVPGIGHWYCTRLQRADGYGYHL